MNLYRLSRDGWMQAPDDRTAFQVAPDSRRATLRERIWHGLFAETWSFAQAGVAMVVVYVAAYLDAPASYAWTLGAMFLGLFLVAFVKAVTEP